MKDPARMAANAAETAESTNGARESTGLPPAVTARTRTVTVNIAREVRRWRVEEDHTWRSVAACADETWGTDTNGNQIFGRALCSASARLLGEDPDSEPWN
jgi:hypothetical protein